MGEIERAVKCESCGNDFGCGIDSGSCWCAQVPLDPRALLELRGRYDDCLCPACLKKARGGGPS